MLLFSHKVVFDSFRLHGLQHARLLCPSLSPGVCSDLCPLSQWCYLILSSSAVLFSFASSPSQHQGLFQWVGSSHQVAKVWSFSFSIRPSNEYSGLEVMKLLWLSFICWHRFREYGQKINQLSNFKINFLNIHLLLGFTNSCPMREPMLIINHAT